MAYVLSRFAAASTRPLERSQLTAPATDYWSSKQLCNALEAIEWLQSGLSETSENQRRSRGQQYLYVASAYALTGDIHNAALALKRTGAGRLLPCTAYGRSTNQEVCRDQYTLSNPARI